MIAIVESTGTNFSSVRFALQRIKADAVVTNDWSVISGADHVILPGVGSAITAMQKLRSAGLSNRIPSLTQPVLGICLGMQVMFERSQEGDTECLSIFEGKVEKLRAAPGMPVPHMGWNKVGKEWAYFVHAYAAPPGANTVATTEYGVAFSSVVSRDNFTGVQFHPERSAEFGSRILKSFLTDSSRDPKWISSLQST